MTNINKIKKAYKAMTALGYSDRNVVKPILKRLLNVYDNQWELIESDNYQVLVDAILESQEEDEQQKDFDVMQHDLYEEEVEDSEPLLKRPRRNREENQSSASLNDSILNCSNQPHGNESMYRPSQDENAKREGSSKDYNNGKGIILINQNQSEVVLDCEPLDVAIPAPSSPKDASPRGKTSKGNSSGLIVTAQSDVGEHEKSVQDKPMFEIASSSDGKVNICLMMKSPLGPNFNVPSIEEVIEEVEVQCIKKYCITEAGFSIPKLMSDVCERFLAVGATSSSAEMSNPENAALSVAKGTSLQLSVCDESAVTNFHADVHKLIDRSPQIPRPFGENRLQLDLSHGRVHLDVTDSNEKGSGMMEVDYLTPSNVKMIVQKQQPFGHYVADITKGQERKGISVCNDINEEQLPTFKYIAKNMIFQNAYVKFQLARISDENCCHNCYGDCLSLAIPCACSSETGGEFAYTQQGLLKEKFLDNYIQTKKSAEHCNLFYCQDCPLERSGGDNQSGKCKGHIMRKFIKECWFKCGCSMKCGNRVLQQGIRVKLQVFMTSGPKGWGVRILEDVPKGTFICEYVGEVVTNIELYERNTQTTGERHTYPVLLDADWSCEGILKDEEALCLDATKYGNVARFMNHRCFDGNCVEIPVEVESPDHHYYHLAFFTTRDINAFEELTWDYGIDFADDSHPVKAFRCHCGSKFCRDKKVTGLEMVLVD